MKLDKTVDILSGYAFNSSNFNNEGRGTPLIRIRDVNANQTKTFFDGNYPKEYLVENGDLLVGMDGNFNLVEWRGGRALMNQRICKIIPKKDLISKDFIKYLMPKSLKEIEDRTSFATVKHLSVKKIKEIKLPNYNLKTQQRIAEILDNAAAMRDKTAQLLKEYDLLAQSIFLEMFGDPEKNDKGWPKTRFDKLVSINCPLTYGIVQPGEEFENGIPCVRPVDLISQYISVDKLKKIDPIISEKFSRTLLKGGEVLLSVRGSVGVISIADSSLKGANVTRGIVPIWFDEEVSNKLFFYYLYKTKRIQNQIKRLSKGATLIQINLKDLRELILIHPPIILQNQFAEKIALIEQQKELAKQELKESEDLFNCLLQKAFKGGLV